ncbi:DUF2188 domain-containing protein [Paenibacillus sp. IB182496]|uniref:DUF2188 domain-containing protein n=1 Tax=Paenibacillus sabuli TaxID=2772509 RepID=A0A927BWJ0_9BACL|nr:DUF2188 domain-containing protein [Paenibacillus sabuli]MBD2846940.1 DUF2188 domain-containing protein [Paenibacillus sabuli]
MPWTRQDYPDSLKNLEARTRNKAIEIANALLDDGYSEGRAIPIATSQAKSWAEEHPQHEGKGDEPHVHVVPHDQGWALKSEGAQRPERVLDTKDEAVKLAKERASERNSTAVIHRMDGTVETTHNYS